MSRLREILVILCMLSLAATVAFLLTRRPQAVTGPPLPAGKVEPFFSGDLFLAPDRTIWRIDHIPARGAASMKFPPFVPGNDWVALSGSHFAGMAIKEDGSLWSWLTHYPGRSSSPIFDPPAPLGSDRNWAQVRYGWNCALLLKKDGSLWFLGGSFIDSSWGLSRLEPGMLPVRVGSDDDWITIETCALVHYALKRDGTLWHWGDLGHGSYEETPQLLGPEPEWNRISAGSFHLTALKRDGSLWLLGANSRIVASDFASGPTSVPLRVGSDSDWVKIVSGGNSLVAQKADGSWWASGENHYAHLGLPHWFGHSKHLSQPNRTPIDLDVWAWSIGENTTRILTHDGKFYYLGKRPGSRHSTGVVTSLQETVNMAPRWIPGIPPLFPRPGEDWSQTPVKMGELPPSVISALQGGH